MKNQKIKNKTKIILTPFEYKTGFFCSIFFWQCVAYYVVSASKHSHTHRKEKIFETQYEIRDMEKFLREMDEHKKTADGAAAIAKPKNPKKVKVFCIYSVISMCLSSHNYFILCTHYPGYHITRRFLILKRVKIVFLYYVYTV